MSDTTMKIVRDTDGHGYTIYDDMDVGRVVHKSEFWVRADRLHLLASCAQAALAEHNSGVMGAKPCPYCDGEKRIETDNNGPIVDCPVCNGSGHSTQNTKDQDTRTSE